MPDPEAPRDPRNRAIRPTLGEVLAAGTERDDHGAATADRWSSDADVASASADIAASGRDDDAVDREVLSQARDSAATARDRSAEERELAEGLGALTNDGPAQARAQAAADRGLAAADRVRAASDRRDAESDRRRAADDREHAAMDREHAAMDRRFARSDLERSNTDELTGAYRRRAGEAALELELERADRSGECFVVAYIDVDGLKETNDRFGHAAGDARLRGMVEALKTRVRRRDPIVRFGGDEFVCSVTNVPLTEVRGRFDALAAELGAGDGSGSLSVGLVERRAGETLAQLIDGADAALMASRPPHRRRVTD